MRQSKINPLSFYWLVLAVVLLSLSACSKDDATTESGIRFTNYYPDIARDFCTYKSEFVFGRVANSTEQRRLTRAERDDPVNEFLLSTKVEGSTARVPYLSGALPVTRYLTRLAASKAETSASLVYKDNNTLKFLGYGELPDVGVEVKDWWYGSAKDLGNHPNVWSFGMIRDGEIRDKDTEFYYIDPKSAPLKSVGSVAAQTILTKIANVKLESGLVFDNAVIFYYLHAGSAAYTDLDMDYIDVDLGIALPSGIDTGGIAVEYIEIYGRNTGLVASGHFNIKTTEPGRLHHFIELTDVVTCNP